jgi:uncharacterized protein (DUF2267 family)
MFESEGHMSRLNSYESARRRRDIHHLDKTVMKAKEWLRVIQHDLDLETEHDAYSALRAILHGLRDHMNTDEVAHLAAPLPTIIRGVYYEGWDPHIKTQRIHNPGEFFEEVKQHIREGLDPADVTEGVLRFLENKLGKTEMTNIKNLLHVGG